MGTDHFDANRLHRLFPLCRRSYSDPLWDAITLVPMFPHTLSARPLVINSSSTIRLRFSHRRNDLEISCDSQIALPIQEGEDVLDSSL